VTLYNGVASDQDDNVNLDLDWDVNLMLLEHPHLTNLPRDNPKNHTTTMPCWNSAYGMIKNLHSEYTKVQSNWKKSGEHKDATDVLEGMHCDILKDKTMDNKTKVLFHVVNQKCLYYFLMMAKHGANFFTAVTASLPEGIVFNSSKPKAGMSQGCGGGRGRGKGVTPAMDTKMAAMNVLVGEHRARSKLQGVAIRLQEEVMLHGRIKS
jgi:hypothetical protein